MGCVHVEDRHIPTLIAAKDHPLGHVGTHYPMANNQVVNSGGDEHTDPPSTRAILSVYLVVAGGRFTAEECGVSPDFGAEFR